LLACLFSHPSNVLVLDEPTNDLDMETLDLLAELLADYKGTVLTVSHDRAFLDSVATSILAIEDGGNVFEAVGGYSDYEENRKFREKERAFAEKGSAKNRILDEKSNNLSNVAKKKKRSYNEEREFAALPEKIESLESKITEIQADLAKPEVYTDAKRIVELQKELADLNAELEKAYERYGELDALGG
jgi:ATP-binding cassette subfamily F protein uup